MVSILLSGTTARGFLAEALTCVVTEERNGVFELELTYSVSGLMFPELCADRLIKAKLAERAVQKEQALAQLNAILGAE